VKHFLSTRSLSARDVVALLDSTMDMSRKRAAGDSENLPLRGKTVANAFFEDSTRTRLSFELAARALGAEVLTFTAASSSLSKGESLKDTLRTLEAMGAGALVLRHADSGAAETAVRNEWVNAHIVNAGDGTHEHPTQALLDAYTIRSRFFGSDATGKTLDGLRVVIVGDVLHSRVARSNMRLLTTLGAEVSIASPVSLQPKGVSQFDVKVFGTLDDALDTDPNVVMTLRVQRERMTSGFFPTESEYATFWGMSAARLSKLSDSSIVMHPGPMNRGLEIASSVADSSQSTVTEQVANGIAARMAVLNNIMGGH